MPGSVNPPSYPTHLKLPIGSVEKTINLLFLLKNNKNQRTSSLQNRLGANCCLYILNYIILNCLRVLRDHTTPTFSDFKMRVYGKLNESLW